MRRECECLSVGTSRRLPEGGLKGDGSLKREALFPGEPTTNLKEKFELLRDNSKR